MRHWLLTTIVLIGCIGPWAKPDDAPTLQRQYILDSLTIEVQPVNGLLLDPQQIRNFKVRYQQYNICAVGSINFIIRPSVPSSDARWTVGDIANFETQHRTLCSNDPRHMVVFLAHVNGRLEEFGMEYVAGVALSGNIVFYFNQADTRLEAPILIHEIGHLLGLVDRSKREGPPINPNAPPHCNTVNCVMFWQADLMGNFDDLCQKDIRDMINGPIRSATGCGGFTLR